MEKTTNDVTQFHSVDQTTHPAFFVQFMNTSHTQEAGLYRQMMMQLLAIHEGAAILDVGCGTGQDTLDLARAVGPHGRVVGIDLSETMLQEARTRASHEQLPVEYTLADATHLPFEDASFDGCQAARILGHLQAPEQALAEMVRVARPGARIVAADGDLDLTVIELSDRTLTRKMIHAACDQMQQGWMGRQMPRLFKQAGLNEITVEGRMMPLNYTFFQMAYGGILQRAQAKGAISAEELTRFWHELEQAEQAQHFFAGTVGFIVSGRKPANR